MNKKVINGLTVNYDIDSILNQITNWSYNEDDYDGQGECHIAREYKISEKSWEESKAKFIKEVELLKEEDGLIRVINTIARNKNGSMSKNRKNKLVSFGAVRDYNDSYGSHAYTVDCVGISKDSELEVTLELTHYKEQSSF